MFESLALEEPRRVGIGLASVGSWAGGLLLSAVLLATRSFGHGESGLIEIGAFAYLLTGVMAAASSIGLALSIAGLVRSRQSRLLAVVGFALNLITLVTLSIAFFGTTH